MISQSDGELPRARNELRYKMDKHCWKTKSGYLISWDEEFTEKSVAHWSKAKLKGSEKENKNSNNEDAASEHLTEEKAAK